MLQHSECCTLALFRKGKVLLWIRTNLITKTMKTTIVATLAAFGLLLSIQPAEAGWADLAKKGAEYAKKKADEKKKASSQASDTPASEITTPKDTDVLKATVRKSVQLGGGLVLQLTNTSDRSVMCTVNYENQLNGKTKQITVSVPRNGMKEIGALELKQRITEGCLITVTIEATGETHTYEF